MFTSSNPEVQKRLDAIIADPFLFVSDTWTYADVRRYKNKKKLQKKHPEAIIVRKNKYCNECNYEIKRPEPSFALYKIFYNPWTNAKEKLEICFDCSRHLKKEKFYKEFI